jgi:hypothetical protein
LRKCKKLILRPTQIPDLKNIIVGVQTTIQKRKTEVKTVTDFWVV